MYSKLFNWDKKKVILIISSGRTGTNFMAHWFSTLSDEFYSVHEPSPDLFQLGIEKLRWIRLKLKEPYSSINSIKKGRRFI